MDWLIWQILHCTAVFFNLTTISRNIETTVLSRQQRGASYVWLRVRAEWIFQSVSWPPLDGQTTFESQKQTNTKLNSVTIDLLPCCDIQCLSLQDIKPLGAVTLQSLCSEDIGHWTLGIGHWTLDIGHWTRHSQESTTLAHSDSSDVRSTKNMIQMICTSPSCTTVGVSRLVGL